MAVRPVLSVVCKSPARNGNGGTNLLGSVTGSCLAARLPKLAHGEYYFTEIPRILKFDVLIHLLHPSPLSNTTLYMSVNTDFHYISIYYELKIKMSQPEYGLKQRYTALSVPKRLH